MLEEPYRWVEAIQNRREYLEDQLRGASPVGGLSYEDGILLLTTTPGPCKLFEVYDDLSFAAIGHPADIEKLRKAVIDIAHLEAFNFSAKDVSLQRLVSFGIGPLIKAAFDEIFRSPFIARVLMAELDPQSSHDRFCVIDADGSFRGEEHEAAVAGSENSVNAICKSLRNEATTERSLSQALDAGLQAWAAGRVNLENEALTHPDKKAIEGCLQEALESQRFEAAVLDRTRSTKSKFALLAADEIDAVLAAYR